MTPNPSKPTNLSDIATAMYDTLAPLPAGRRHIALKLGLNIVLERNADNWLLKLGRQAKYPSDLETVLCKRAFRLADDHKADRLDPAADGWHVVALRWTGPTPQLQTPYPAKPGMGAGVPPPRRRTAAD